jgi:hypothetical protein
MVPTSQLLRLEFFEEEQYLSALERLQAGVPWAAAGGRLVYGWSIKESILAVRVSGCPRRVSVEKLAAHLSLFGRVSRLRTPSRPFSPPPPSPRIPPSLPASVIASSSAFCPLRTPPKSPLSSSRPPPFPLLGLPPLGHPSSPPLTALRLCSPPFPPASSPPFHLPSSLPRCRWTSLRQPPFPLLPAAWLGIPAKAQPPITPPPPRSGHAPPSEWLPPPLGHQRPWHGVSLPRLWGLRERHLPLGPPGGLLLPPSRLIRRRWQPGGIPLPSPSVWTSVSVSLGWWRPRDCKIAGFS